MNKKNINYKLPISKIEYLQSDSEDSHKQYSSKINSINLIDHNLSDNNLSSSDNNVQRILKNNIVIYGKRQIYPLEYQDKHLKRVFKGFINLN